MSIPVYVLLPDGVEWQPVPGTSAQTARPVRWYLRQAMPHATTQTGVFVDGEGPELAELLEQLVMRAERLGGLAIDAATQEPLAAHLDRHRSAIDA